ncbi:uncharacterized protein LOC114517284 [Dendronephthya gigantea]|uniref:uncharacterized protein LOC114517284 n=1 Tax=Dendronephthya gigantea TaxID=151771 RepID=UPI00106C30C2|nr:uncharacterized protein LOC114517284 [Dendronephthya gigantea]
MANNCKRVVLVLLAIAEMVAFVIAAGSVGYFMDQLDKTIIDISEKSGTNVDIGAIFDSGVYGREEFFLFGLGTGFFVALLSLVIAIAGLQDTVHYAASIATFHAYSALVLLVSGSLLAKTNMRYESKHLCKFLDIYSKNSRCYQLTMGLAFGFVSMALLIGDAIIYSCSLARNVGVSFVNMENMAS